MGWLLATSGFASTRAITLGASNGVIDVATGELSLSGAITGGGFEKDGTGILRLTRANSYQGGTQTSDGMLITDADGALGNGPVLIDGASAHLHFSSGVSAGGLSIWVYCRQVAVVHIAPLKRSLRRGS